ncbi:hypothetical protein PYCCODRAFT_1429036 [Trametes coccinea BRFM310]|uniref:Uncharacterized protein n=1 Tax=Trametes coccinea (strain BRFM310) TaxID=1353009 RepID=A0A1Y2I5W6_TRAC3|nr:hypothetical protein PYCCODRAFT_1429036 [Trametes coccinea BRFM310]
MPTCLRVVHESSFMDAEAIALVDAIVASGDYVVDLENDRSDSEGDSSSSDAGDYMLDGEEVTVDVATTLPQDVAGLLDWIAGRRGALRRLSALIDRERIEFLREFGLSTNDATFWLANLGRFMLRENAAARRVLRARLSEAFEAVRARETVATIDGLLSAVGQNSIDIERSILSMQTLFAAIRPHLPVDLEGQIKEKVASAGEHWDSLMTAQRLTRAQVNDFRPCLEILSLSRADFAHFLASLPTYSSEGAIQSRLIDAINKMRDVIVDCRAFQNVADVYTAEVLETWHMEQDQKARTQLALMFDALYGQLWAQAVAQRSAFTSIRDELEDAKRMLAKAPAMGPNVQLDDLTDAFMVYDGLHNDLKEITQGQLRLQEIVGEATGEILILNAIRDVSYHAVAYGALEKSNAGAVFPYV